MIYHKIEETLKACSSICHPMTIPEANSLGGLRQDQGTDAVLPLEQRGHDPSQDQEFGA